MDTNKIFANLPTPYTLHTFLTHTNLLIFSSECKVQGKSKKTICGIISFLYNVSLLMLSADGDIITLLRWKFFKYFFCREQKRINFAIDRIFSM